MSRSAVVRRAIDRQPRSSRLGSAKVSAIVNKFPSNLASSERAALPGLYAQSFAADAIGSREGLVTSNAVQEVLRKPGSALSHHDKAMLEGVYSVLCITMSLLDENKRDGDETGTDIEVALRVAR